MELTAALRALESLKKSCTVDLTTDSQYLKQGVEQWMAGWKRNGWRTSGRDPVKNRDLWEAIDRVLQGIGKCASTGCAATTATPRMKPWMRTRGLPSATCWDRSRAECVRSSSTPKPLDWKSHAVIASSRLAASSCANDGAAVASSTATWTRNARSIAAPPKCMG